MKSKEYTEHLRTVAAALDAREEFEFDFATIFNHDAKGINTTLNFDDKAQFVSAAKTIGAADKEYGEGEYANFQLVSKTLPLKLSISRDKVCRKVVKFECEPLFSTEELAAL